MAAVAMWRRSVDDEAGGPGGGEDDHLLLESVDAVSGRFEKNDCLAANEELVAALILVLIYAWNCAKYRAQIGGFDENRAKYSQNEVALFFSVEFALIRAIWALQEKSSQFFDPSPLCQMNSTLTL